MPKNQKTVDQLWNEAVQARVAYGNALRKARLAYKATKVHNFPMNEHNRQLDAFVAWAVAVNHRGIEKMGSNALWNLEQSLRNSN